MFTAILQMAVLRNEIHDCGIKSVYDKHNQRVIFKSPQQQLHGADFDHLLVKWIKKKII